MKKFFGKIKQYLFNVLIGIDQLANAITGGDPDETISSRLGKNFPNSIMRKFVDLLFGKGHSKGAIEEDEGDDAVLD